MLSHFPDTGFHMKSIIVFGLGHLFQEFLKRYDAEKINILAIKNDIAAFRQIGKMIRRVIPV
mgnify:CR=1 FL=1